LKAEIWTERVAPEDWDFLRETIVAYRSRVKTPFRVEFRILAGGRQTCCELRAIVTGKVDSTEHCLGLIADVTARKSAEAARKPLAGVLTA
jgi:hypothetical protein